MITLDATAIDCWLRCREEYRRRYVENIVPIEPSIHLSFGHAVHVAVEAWHKGYTYENALGLAVQEMEDAARELEGKLNPKTELKWRELGLALPECVAAYCDGVEPDPEAEVEKEWKFGWRTDGAGYVTLAGKIDRYSGRALFDVKTASEIGQSWRHDYRETLLRTFQFGLYDWWLRQQGVTPESIKVECIVKPYRGKQSRLEIFDLPEITVYRKRFDMQLDWIVYEIQRYHDKYGTVKPWPQASSQACHGKFSACDYLPICNHGEGPKIMLGYGERKEHLVCLMPANSSSGEGKSAERSQKSTSAKGQSALFR